MTLAKALANGVPIGATLARKDVASALTPGTHGTTFGGTPFVTSVALACFTTVLDEKIPERAASTGRYLTTPSPSRDRHPAHPRGPRPWPPHRRRAGPLPGSCSRLREGGVLVLTAGEKVLRLAPPLIVEERDCDRALDVIESALGRAAG